MTDFGVRHRVWQAIEQLAMDPKPLRERALDAYSVQMSPLLAREFEGKARSLFEQLQRLVTDKIAKTQRHPEPYDLEVHGGAFEITKKKIRDTTGRKIAALIIEIYKETAPDED